MVDDEIRDGRRIAELFASEIDGREDGALAAVGLTVIDEDAEGSPYGEHAYDVTVDGGVLAGVHVHEDRAHLEFGRGIEAAAEAATERDLRIRPKATDPPRTLVFVERGAEVKRAVEVIDAAATADPE
ncbi:MAG: hypothetical protein ACI8XM_001021 [Haloarculaceae archaeon]|jgi:hypothetical protein